MFLVLRHETNGFIGLPMPRYWKNHREGEKARRRDAWQNSAWGETPDLVRKKDLKRKEQRERAEARQAAASSSDRGHEVGQAVEPAEASAIKVAIYAYGIKYHGHLGHGSYDHYIDCTGIEDPNRDRKVQAHIGLHEEIVSRLESHQDMDGHLRFLAQFLHRSVADEIRMGIFCRAGRHRSVAMAFLVGKALEKLNCQVSVTYVERDANNWQRLCTDCPKCKDTELKDQCAERMHQRLLAHLKEQDPDPEV